MFNLVKGTHDVILDEARQYSYIESVLSRVAEIYSYQEFRTPILETTELFTRNVGGSTDIVRKEMYTFDDKGGRSISLRPEFTASVVRAMVNNKLFAMQDYPVKAYYCGPNFRYERPQQGRYRQFNQFGVECVGVNSPERDAEVISMGYNSLLLLGFENVKLVINTLGDEETRKNYQEALREYFAKHIDNMCSDCKERFNINILRILDCKVPEDREIIAGAPKITDFLSQNARNHFNKVLEQLDKLEVIYEIDSELVRGLDYYSGVVFEFHYTSSVGKNYGAIGAGGHYGHLVSQIGGPDIEGIGYAFGIERLASVMNDDGMLSNIKNAIDVYVMPLGDVVKDEILEITESLRLSGISSEVCLENKGMSQMFKKAERRNAKYALIIGEDELKSGIYSLKDLESQQQIQVRKEDLIKVLDNFLDREDEEPSNETCCCGKHAKNECCEGEECTGEENNHECCCGKDK